MNKFLLPSFLALLLLVSPVAFADISKSQAVSAAQSVYPGRVLAAKLVQQNEIAVYRIKTLSDGGEVHIVVVDAQSGKIISKR